MLMLISMTFTLVQGHSGSTKATNQRWIISTTKQAISIKLVTTVSHFYVTWTLKTIILWLGHLVMMCRPIHCNVTETSFGVTGYLSIWPLRIPPDSLVTGNYGNGSLISILWIWLNSRQGIKVGFFVTCLLLCVLRDRNAFQCGRNNLVHWSDQVSRLFEGKEGKERLRRTKYASGLYRSV